MCFHKTFKNHSDKQEIVDQIKDIRKVSLPPKDCVFVFILLYFFIFCCSLVFLSILLSLCKIFIFILYLCLPFFFFTSLDFLIRFPKAMESIYLPIPVANIKHYYYYYYYVYNTRFIHDKISLWYIESLEWDLLAYLTNSCSWLFTRHDTIVAPVKEIKEEKN